MITPRILLNSPRLAALFVVLPAMCFVLKSRADESARPPVNPSDAEILQKWTPGGDTNVADLPYRHRFEAFEWETDADWIDDRWARTDWGPFVAHSTEVPGQPLRPKNLTLFLNREKSAAAVFDIERCVVTAIVSPASFQVDPARFGLLRKPKLVGTPRCVVSGEAIWRTLDADGTPGAKAVAPKYRGLRLHGSRVLLEYELDGVAIAETVWREAESPEGAFVRQMEFAESPRGLAYKILDGRSTESNQNDESRRIIRHNDELTVVALQGDSHVAAFVQQPDGVWLHVAPREKPVTVTWTIWNGAAKDQQTFENWRNGFTATPCIDALRVPGPARWGEPINQKIDRSNDRDQPYVLDEIRPPFDNRHKALFFLSGVDFFDDGTAAVCTAHGDVWLVHGLNEQSDSVKWRRYATGLYQPLGIKVNDGRVIVLGRDQITRLHDLNDDGEADWYEAFNHDLNIHGQDHAYAMRLDTDHDGNFYFLKSGEPPDGSALYRLSSGGERLERIATGFRHPFGMGVGPNGEITVADNEGNWVPSSKIDWITPDGFYGFLGGEQTAPRGVRPLRPLCYIPKVADNASGGQVWATSPRWGSFHLNEMLHFSWGRGTMHAVLRQRVGEVHQAATVAFPNIKFTSGPSGAAFNPADGQLYVVGMDGWQTAATRDGCLTRVRYTGAPIRMPCAFRAHSDGLFIEFTEPLDPVSATKLESYRVNRWNYKWSSTYGSYHYSVALPDRVGHDGVAVDRVELLPDGRSVFLQMRELQPVDQLHVHVNLRTENGRPMAHDIYSTINAVAEPFPTHAPSASAIFEKENLVAWCIVPFDAKKRGPAERVQMLNRLGIRRVAYDWRAEHVAQFDEELAAYKKHDIALTAFWTPVNSAHPLNEPHVRTILDALRRNEARTQLWVMLGEGLLAEAPADRRPDRAAEILLPLAREANAIGCCVGLYNHGGWFGDVRNQIAIIKCLEKEMIFNVGIVYNLHHAHHEMNAFPDLLAEMRPYLYALNLNGMKKDGPKIVPIGHGDDDASLLRTILASGYRGPIGILDHRDDVDTEAALLENLDGLKAVASQLEHDAN